MALIKNIKSMYRNSLKKMCIIIFEIDSRIDRRVFNLAGRGRPLQHDITISTPSAKGTRARRDEHLHMHQIKKNEGTGVHDRIGGGLAVHRFCL